MKMNHNKRHYILSPMYVFRGWRLLPYAIQARYRQQTEFFYEDDWALISACDGKTAIGWDGLTRPQKERYEHWEKNGFIHQCSAEERLLPIQEYRFYPARFKESVQWSVTGRCNYRCRHCFMSAPHAAQGEPSFEQLMVMLDAFERCGVHSISITGGEPLVRKDFWQLVDEILARDMLITTVFSNGLLVTDEFLDKLQERGLYPSIQFSFDGTGFHDWMRGVPGAEKAVTDAMRRCRQRGIRMTASMVMFRENAESIRDSVRLLADLGVYALKVGLASPQGEWKNEKEHYLSQAELYEAFLKYIPRYVEDGMPLSIDLEGFFNYNRADKSHTAVYEKNIPEKNFGDALMCGHVRRSLYVSPKGNVLPCMSMVGGPIEELFPNMLESPLEEILDQDSLYMKITNYRVSDFMEHNPQCRECRYKAACCGGCRAIAVRDNPTDYLAKDPVTCEYFRGGWQERRTALLQTLSL